MPMTPEVKKELEKEQMSDFHTAILKKCRDCVAMSRSHMSKYYRIWDNADDVFHGKIVPDEKDKKAEKRGEPGKMIVPLSYAQVMTFVCFVYLLYTQRDKLYELETEPEEADTDEGLLAQDAEDVLERDLRYNKARGLLFQFLLDLARFGIGIKKHGWVKETMNIPVTETRTETKDVGQGLATVQGSSTTTTNQEFVKFHGNRMMAVSAYRFFPDTRLPITRFQEGEFCGSEDEYSRPQLKQMEKDGCVAGIKWIPSPTARMFSERGAESRNSIVAQFNTQANAALTPKGAVCDIVTEVQIKIVPKDFDITDGKPMGDEDFPVLYLVWYANDSRVIRCEPMGYLHNQFTYVVGQMNPDIHNIVNLGLSDTIDALQSVVTWLINAHISSLRKNIGGSTIVDQTAIEIEDIEERRPVIRMKKNAQRSATGLDRFVKQLQVADVTQNYMTDAQALINILMLVTGVNENAMGQYHGGRRSASESRAVNVGAASRMRTIADLTWEGAIEPEGQMLLCNLRYELDYDTFQRIVGKDQGDGLIAQRFRVFQGEIQDLIEGSDFKVYDGTLPSQKGVIAQQLQGLVEAIITNPTAAAILQLDPDKVWMQLLRLQGIRNPEQFRMSAGQVQQMQMRQAQMAALTNPPQPAQPPQIAA